MCSKRKKKKKRGCEDLSSEGIQAVLLHVCTLLLRNPGTGAEQRCRLCHFKALLFVEDLTV